MKKKNKLLPVPFFFASCTVLLAIVILIVAVPVSILCYCVPCTVLLICSFLILCLSSMLDVFHICFLIFFYSFRSDTDEIRSVMYCLTYLLYQLNMHAQSHSNKKERMRERERNNKT